METQLQDKHQSLKRTSLISIKPYVEQDKENMGLEIYGMSLFEGAMYEEPVSYKEVNGVQIFKTGLNEFAVEVQNLPTEEKEAKIKEIRTIVADLEKKMSSNIIDIKDEKFWTKVLSIRNDNVKLWNSLVLRVSNEPVYLDPATDSKDMLLYKAIEAGGFSFVACSLEHARANSPKYKFYLDKFEETISLRTEVKKIRNKALAELEKMFNKNQTKLFFITKILDSNSPQYRKSTPIDVLYDNMDKYINGELVDKDKKKTAQIFLDISNLDIETLKLRALVKDSTFYKIFATKPDGYIYHIKSNTMMGKNPSDCVEFLKNPLHEDVLNETLKYIEKFWNN